MATENDEPVPKDFDCLAYKQRVQDEIYEQTKGMTHAQEIEYYRKSAEEGPLADWWKQLREHTARRKNPTDPAI